jgi:hypothetical protein
MAWRATIAGVASLVLVTLASSARAGDAKSTNSDIKSGDIPEYRDEATAQAGCRPDGVVWADRRSGFFYPKFLTDYGKTPYGTYTCYTQAQKANYWGLTPASDGGHKGREFPLFFCTICS